jgi:hypothetical protein
MAYLASRSDVLMASQAIFHLSHLKFVGVPTWLMSGKVAGNVVNEEDGSIQGAHGSR